MTSNNSEIISIKKNQLKIAAIVVAILVGLCFIPSEKEVSLPEYEHSTKYSNAISYQYKAYKTNTGCLDDAWWDAHGDSDKYDSAASKCKPIETDKTANVVVFNNGLCNPRLDYEINIVVDDCDTFYIKNGSLYSDLQLHNLGNGKYRDEYDDKVDIKYISGSSIRVETYYTATCRAFGLICSSGEWLADGTTMHTRLVIGENAKIDRYSSICDGYSGKAMKNNESCIYADDHSKTISIKELLKT